MFVAPLSRRRFLQLSAAGAAAGALGAVGHGAAPPEAPGGDTGAEFITPATQAAIDRGLAYLAQVQQDDGSFTGGRETAVGVSAIAGLALMAGGNQPGRGRYGQSVARVADYILAAANPSTGYLGGPDVFGGARGLNQNGMYNHGFGCLFLSEVSGMLPDAARQRRVKAALEQATAYTVKARNREGGWRYDKSPPIADVSVTVAQMMALRAAKNAGAFVRKNVIDDGVEFIKGCQCPDGGFSYLKGQGGGSAFARSAAAIVGLYSAGVYTGREVDRGLRYLLQFVPGQQFAGRMAAVDHYYYGQYYAALAMWTAGGEYWAQWFPAIRDELLGRARGGAGVWLDDRISPAYATAMSLIVLQLPNNYLPILQK